MIEKVIRLRGVGLLHDALPTGAVDLGRLTLIYSENGRGKSTFASICRSLCDGSRNTILCRKTIGGQHQPAVEFLIDSRDYRYERGQWSDACQDVLVYDSLFVDKNVYSGMRLGPEHRENLLEFALGEGSVVLNKQIVAVARRIHEIDRGIRESTTLIKAVSGLMDVEEYVELDPPPNTSQLLRGARERLTHAENAEVIQGRPLLSKTDLPLLEEDKIQALLSETFGALSSTSRKRGFPTVGKSIFAKEVKDILPKGARLDWGGRGIERMVQMHMRKHLPEVAASWIRQGLEYENEQDTCPFCGQSLKGLGLVRAFRRYFGQRYDNLRERITRLQRTVEMLFRDMELVRLEGVIKHNEAVRHAWADYKDLEFPSSPAVEPLRTIWQSLRDGVTRVLREKNDAVLSSFELPTHIRMAIRHYLLLRSGFEQYDNDVTLVNRRIKEIKTRLGAQSIEAIRKEVFDLETLEKRLNKTVSRECTKYRTLKIQKAKLESERSGKKKERHQYTSDLLARYGETINSLLSSFGAGFSIAELTAINVDATPRTDYRIEILGQNVPALDTDDVDDNLSFANTLSDGDKRTLALAFFLARLMTDTSSAKKIVVIDDPVSSFDVNRRNATVEVSEKLSNQCAQLIVLSHDAYFLRDLLVKTDGRAAVWQIRRQGVYSVFDSCDLHEICESEYYKNYRLLAGYISQGYGGDPVDIAKAIRPYIEANLRYKYPIELRDAFNLGEMLRRIRGSDNGAPLALMKPQLPDLTRINRFASPFMHADDVRAPRSPLTDSELKPVVELALRIGRI